MTFDKVIMNPPYPTQSSSFPIHIEIMDMAQKVSNNVVSLAPTGFMQDPVWEFKRGHHRKRYNEFTHHIKDIEIFESKDANDQFGTEFAVDIGIFTIDKGTYTPPEYYKDKWFCENVVKAIISDESMSIKNYFEKKPSTEYFCAIPKIHGHHAHLDEYDAYDVFSVQKKFVRNLSSGNSAEYISFKTDEEAENFRKSLMMPFIKYINYNVKRGLTNFFPVIPYMKDYSHVWTDKDYAKYFKVPDKKIKEIEELVEKWNKTATKYYLDGLKESIG